MRPLIAAGITALLLLSGCATAPRPATAAADIAADQRGTASWYGERYHGRTTASGETFDMHGLTAAHKTLPFGTRVEVRNLRNGRSVIVRINDRGALPGGRVIDLSYGAAKRLDFIEAGLTPVELRVLR